MFFAIIFLERMGLGRGSSWEIQSGYCAVSWDPILFVIPAGPVSIFIQFLPFPLLLSLELPPGGGSHIFSGRDYVDIKSQIQCPREHVH